MKILQCHESEFLKLSIDDVLVQILVCCGVGADAASGASLASTDWMPIQLPLAKMLSYCQMSPQELKHLWRRASAADYNLSIKTVCSPGSLGDREAGRI